MTDNQTRPASVELPVMPGDDVWVLVRSTGEIHRQRVTEIILKANLSHSMVVTRYNLPNGCTVTPRRRLSQIGRTVFATREAAEAALEQCR